MITANVVQAVQELLKERGIVQEPNERLGGLAAVCSQHLSAIAL